MSSKSITTLVILAKGIQYQPGGLAERTAILTALECPTEASTVGAAIATLKKAEMEKTCRGAAGFNPRSHDFGKGPQPLGEEADGQLSRAVVQVAAGKSAVMVDAVPCHESPSIPSTLWTGQSAVQEKRKSWNSRSPEA